ncbi:hypothetical protein Goshw_012015 [Gossypium schwendimanii]|uniref:Uncharacterized protein n=1 Tax=Gossypium schwendimanii TaxID=34291 RepID=A0A7J9NAE5_GOSSC|nr:hypothetical protein [Gossypium schwendimanii]MBA0880097.1 hypothetical protein [Gossypium schwendimanii]
MALLQCPKIQVDRAYSRAVSVRTFLKKLMNIIRIMSSGLQLESNRRGIASAFLGRI